jgi:hypothetical protein
MNQQTADPHVAYDICNEGFEQTEHNALDYCAHERRRIELANQPEMEELKHRGRELQSDAKDLDNRIEQAIPVEDEELRRRKLQFYWFAALGLFGATIGLTIFTYQPFRLREAGWLIYVMVPIASLFFVHQTLTVWEHAVSWLLRLFVTTGCVCVLSANIGAGVIRGRILAESLAVVSAPVVVDGEVIQAASNFYAQTALILGMVMALFALATEIGSGLAYHEVERWSRRAGESLAELRDKKTQNLAQQRPIARKVLELEGEPARYEEAFRRDLKRAGRNWSSRYEAAVMGILLLGLGLSGTRASAQTHCLVVAVDLTASVANARGLDGKSEMERNIASVTNVLQLAPPGSHLTLIAITNATFSSPYVLLQATIDGDPGYFQERIKTAHQVLVRTWQKRSATLVSRFGQTDIMGALVLASQAFAAQACRQNMLFIFSDMRQETRELNLEPGDTVPVSRSLAVAERRRLIPDLKGVDAWVMGADDAGKSVAYWTSLRDFWGAYFTKAGANLRGYSTLRELPKFAP